MIAYFGMPGLMEMVILGALLLILTAVSSLALTRAGLQHPYVWGVVVAFCAIFGSGAAAAATGFHVLFFLLLFMILVWIVPLSLRPQSAGVEREPAKADSANACAGCGETKASKMSDPALVPASGGEGPPFSLNLPALPDKSGTQDDASAISPDCRICSEKSDEGDVTLHLETPCGRPAGTAPEKASARSFLSPSQVGWLIGVITVFALWLPRECARRDVEEHRRRHLNGLAESEDPFPGVSRQQYQEWKDEAGERFDKLPGAADHQERFRTLMAEWLEEHQGRPIPEEAVLSGWIQEIRDEMSGELFDHPEIRSLLERAAKCNGLEDSEFFRVKQQMETATQQWALRHMNAEALMKEFDQKYQRWLSETAHVEPIVAPRVTPPAKRVERAESMAPANGGPIAAPASSRGGGAVAGRQPAAIARPHMPAPKAEMTLGPTDVDEEEVFLRIEEAKSRVALAPGDAQAHVALGIYLCRAGDPIAAMQSFTTAIQIDEFSAKAYHNRGVARALLGDRQGAAGDFRCALQIAPYREDTLGCLRAVER